MPLIRFKVRLMLLCLALGALSVHDGYAAARLEGIRMHEAPDSTRVVFDISAAVMMALALPHRATVTELAITATVPRDMSADVRAAMTKPSTD